MRPIQNAGGHVGLSARDYPVATNTAISAGQVVKLADGLVAPADATETGAILGIAAETHAGIYDALNLRADGLTMRVYDSPALIFECPAPTFKAASGGSATQIKAATGDIAAEIADDAFNGAVLVLLEKAAESKNTDPVGTVIRATDYAKEGLAFTKAKGGVPSEGDVYELYPPIGCTVGGLDKSAERLIFSDTGATSIKVAGHDRERHMLRCMATVHTLGAMAAGGAAPAMGSGSVTSDMLAAGAVTEDKIAADAVTTDKIKDANVTKAKLAADAQAGTG